MTVRATSANYIDAYSLYNQFLNNGSGASSGSGASAAISGISIGGNTQTYSSGLMSAEGRKQLGKTFAAMKEEGYTDFTFEGIERYRTIKELEFSRKVKEDLHTIGVAEDIEFRLVADTNGNIQVITDHADKAIVEKYIADNPDVADDIRNIQALSNLKRVTQNAQVRNQEDMIQLKKSLQAEAVEAFFAMNDNNGKDWFSQIAAFDGSEDSARFMLGLGISV
jgi:hypothetical protein